MKYLKVGWVILIGLIVLAGCGNKTKEIYETWLKASKLFKEGKIKEAEAQYKKLIELYPESELRSKAEERLKVCQEILSILELVKKYEASGKYKLALKECEKILPLNPALVRPIIRRLRENEFITVTSGRIYKCRICGKVIKKQGKTFKVRRKDADSYKVEILTQDYCSNCRYIIKHAWMKLKVTPAKTVKQWLEGGVYLPVYFEGTTNLFNGTKVAIVGPSYEGGSYGYAPTAEVVDGKFKGVAELWMISNKPYRPKVFWTGPYTLEAFWDPQFTEEREEVKELAGEHGENLSGPNVRKFSGNKRVVAKASFYIPKGHNARFNSYGNYVNPTPTPFEIIIYNNLESEFQSAPEFADYEREQKIEEEVGNEVRRRFGISSTKTVFDIYFHVINFLMRVK